MTVSYYPGVPGASISVASRADLMEALDVLHTQVINNIGDDDAVSLNALEQAIGLLSEAMLDDESDDEEEA